MTREEAIKEIERAFDVLDHSCHMDNRRKEAFNMARVSLYAEPTLDKIRAEIKTKYDSIPWRNNDYDDGWVEALEWVLDNVIDKYKGGK